MGFDMHFNAMCVFIINAFCRKSSYYFKISFYVNNLGIHVCYFCKGLNVLAIRERAFGICLDSRKGVKELKKRVKTIDKISHTCGQI